MPQKSQIKSLSTPKSLQFHQVASCQGQQPKSQVPSQRVLILSTPIKLKDGSINVEQRTIPLRIDNSPLTVTNTENKNRVVSLKAGSKPPPLALPITQLNKKSTTFVKNEIGQVMGKLIPLGKFSNITGNTLIPKSTVSPKQAKPLITGKNVKRDILKCTSKLETIKIPKLEKTLEEVGIAGCTSTEVPLSSKPKNNSSLALPAANPKLVNIDDQLMTIKGAKPKKQVHLVLKGYHNIASIGQTGTNIKLIPLEQWKLDPKANFMKNQRSSSMISQPKIVDVRSCTEDEMDGSHGTHFNSSKPNSNYDNVKEDFDIEELLEKDPLDLGEMSNEDETLSHSLATNVSKQNRQKNVSDPLETSSAMSKMGSNPGFSKSGGSHTPKVIILGKRDKAAGLQLDIKRESDSSWPTGNSVLLKNKLSGMNSSNINIKNESETDPVNIGSNMGKNVRENTEVPRLNVDHEDLYKRFRIQKSNVTPAETTMLGYIYNLKKKLLRSKKSRLQSLAVLEQREYLRNNLSNVQKRFIESQLRNSGRMSRNQRFTKTDIVMARDILKATGPRGYTNLRKLFSLPNMSAVVKAISKT